VGTAWYEGFMDRYEDVLTRKRVKLRDSNHCTWCTTSNFSSMYHTIYKAMVVCGVAVELEEETMFDREGNIVDDPSKMYGRPTKYQMIKPEPCLFVDETGCNTNQKTDRNVGGEKFFVSVEQDRAGREYKQEQSTSLANAD
jgi:hypothetical protein